MAHNALQDNPFWILGASTRDDRRRLIELADEHALDRDPQTCQKARADLSNPRTRLSAEMAWFPGVSPSRAVQLATQVLNSPLSISQESRLPPLTHTNLMAAAFEGLDETVSSQTMADLIEQMAQITQRCTIEVILRDLNEDRTIAGFPLVKTDHIETELAERARYYRTAIKECLNRLPTVTLVDTLTLVVSRATNGGSSQAPTLIDELVDTYEVEGQQFLQKEAHNVHAVIQAIRHEAERKGQALSALIDALERVVRNWDYVAQPIQLSAQARGLEHPLSHELAYAIRDVAVDLCNKHDLLTESQRLTNLVREVFAELPEFKERVDQDTAALEAIIQVQQQNKAEQDEWARAITYNVEIGALFKHTLNISPSGLTWKHQTWPLNAVTRVRWGGVRQSVNGIPSGTHYTIAFGDALSEAVIELRREQVFTTIVDKLWRAVGARLSLELLRTLRAGNDVPIGDAVLRDDQVLLTKHKLFGNDSVWCSWRATQIWTADGEFYIGSTTDKKVYVGLSYIHVANVHPLEQVLRMAFKTPGGFTLLSDTLS